AHPHQGGVGMKSHPTPMAHTRTMASRWDTLRHRLDAMQAALERDTILTPAAQSTVLLQRAQALAQPLAVDTVPSDTFDCVEFRLAHESYGIASSYVREVYPLRELTPLPGTPPFVLGIINVRGEILSVLD